MQTCCAYTGNRSFLRGGALLGESFTLTVGASQPLLQRHVLRLLRSVLDVHTPGNFRLVCHRVLDQQLLLSGRNSPPSSNVTPLLKKWGVFFLGPRPTGTLSSYRVLRRRVRLFSNTLGYFHLGNPPYPVLECIRTPSLSRVLLLICPACKAGLLLF